MRSGWYFVGVDAIPVPTPYHQAYQEGNKGIVLTQPQNNPPYHIGRFPTLSDKEETKGKRKGVLKVHIFGPCVIKRFYSNKKDEESDAIPSPHLSATERRTAFLLQLNL